MKNKINLPKSKAAKSSLLKSIAIGKKSIDVLIEHEATWEVWKQDRFIDAAYFIGPGNERVTYPELRKIIDENKNPSRHFIVLKYEKREDQYNPVSITMDLSK